MNYVVAEKFKSLQGEGCYAGTPMAFIRFTGCSVGKKICQHCDTDFDVTMPWRGGGTFSHEELLAWAGNYEHICLTGGEPFDQDLPDLLVEAYRRRHMVHIETSGTQMPPNPRADVMGIPDDRMWLCVSPKPGWRQALIELADEIKVIVPGLGTDESLLRLRETGGHVLAKSDNDRFRWPTLEDALKWADEGKTVFLQPRNGKYDVDKQNLLYVQDLLRDHPSLRLSAQLHKILRVQ